MPFENALNVDSTSVGVATVSSLSLLWIGRIIWRRISRDGAEVAKDRAEVNIIETLLNDLSTLKAENSTLRQENATIRKTESEISLRLGRLEAKDQEVIEYKDVIEKLRLKLEEKDLKIEGLIAKHSSETGALNAKLEAKTIEMDKLQSRMQEVEGLLNESKFTRCPKCGYNLIKRE